MRILSVDHLRQHINNAPLTYAFFHLNETADGGFAQTVLTMRENMAIKVGYPTHEVATNAALNGWADNSPHQFLFLHGSMLKWWGAFAPYIDIIQPNYLVAFDEMPVDLYGSTGFLTGSISSLLISSEGVMPHKRSFLVKAMLPFSGQAWVDWFECDQTSAETRNRLIQPVQHALNVYFGNR